MCFILDDILSPGQVGRDGVALLVALMDLPVCARDARKGNLSDMLHAQRSTTEGTGFPSSHWDSC